MKITILGPAKSGKSTVAAVIRNALARQNIRASCIDEDDDFGGPPAGEAVIIEVVRSGASESRLASCGHDPMYCGCGRGG